jgi:hypothetical protein
MVILFGVAGAMLVFAIAAAIIGRETGRLDRQSPRPVYDMDEAVSWIAERLPFDVAAELTHAELRRILLAAVDWFRLLTYEERVAAEDETVTHISEIVGLADRFVRLTVRSQAEYLEAIGATGPVLSEAPERGGGPTAE